MARRDPLQRVGDEAPGATLRLGARLFLLLADAPGELVPDQLLGALEEVRLRLVHGHAGDPLELAQLGVLRRLQLLLELARVHLAVVQPLLAALELDELSLRLLLAAEYALLDLHDLRSPLLDLGLDLGAETHGLLARVDLGLTAERLRLSLGVVEQLRAGLLGRAESRCAEELGEESAGDRSEHEADEDADRKEHGAPPSRRG